MRYGASFKTWAKVSSGYPSNGGGSGLGYAANITLEDFTLKSASGILAVTQCTSYSSASGNCDTSELNPRDITLKNWSGRTTSSVMADIQCSAASPCTGLTTEDIGGIVNTANCTIPDSFLCDNVVDPTVFNCTGKPWEENPPK